MKTIRLPIDENKKKIIKTIDDSIVHWSIEHTKKQIEAQKALSTVNSLYEAKSKTFESIAKTSGIQLDQIESIDIDDGTGEIVIIVDQ